MNTQIAKLLALTQLNGFSAGALWQYLQKSSVDEIYALAQSQQLADMRGRKIDSQLADESSIMLQIDAAQQKSVSIISILDDDYPAQLKHLYDPPILLYVRGDASLLLHSSIGIVGTRKFTEYGERVVTEFVPALVKSGLVITSGMAMGIDTYAHQTCIKNDGKTVAVLGSGVDVPSPAQNTSLYHDIISSGGVVVSEYPLGFAPTKYSFPQRNRIISGLSQGVLVVEAGEKSGALITAQEALEQGREVFAVPGSIFSASSQGTNAIIKQGATPVFSASDLLHVLGFEDHIHPQAAAAHFDDPVQQEIYNLVYTRDVTADELVELVQADASVVLAAITSLELTGVLKRGESGRLMVSSN